MGGMHGFGAVVEPGSDEPYHERWEPRVFAIHLLISTEQLGAGPGGRPTREEMEPAAYLEASYYERWLWSAEQRLARKGTIAPGEVERMMERLDAGEADADVTTPTLVERSLAALARGRTDRAGRAGALRARRPGARAADATRAATRAARATRAASTGVVEGVRGADALPDLAVYGEGGAGGARLLGRVPLRRPVGAGDEPPWTVLLDLWESYLEAA